MATTKVVRAYTAGGADMLTAAATIIGHAKDNKAALNATTTAASTASKLHQKPKPFIYLSVYLIVIAPVLVAAIYTLLVVATAL